MANITHLFTDIQLNKPNYIHQSKGKHFEERIAAKLSDIGYTRLLKKDVESSTFQQIKEAVLNKEGEDIIPNSFMKYEKYFVLQPYGTQNYPDFLIFDYDRILTIETKFSDSTQGKPVWNSGLPRLNGIYLFASSKLNDITFFLGKDVLTIDEIKHLHDFFDRGLKEYQQRFNSDEMNTQKYGFAVYIRKAFEQKKMFNKEAVINFFTNDERDKLEQSVLDYLHR